jgi:CheY-like chemotaxis protein
MTELRNDATERPVVALIVDDEALLRMVMDEVLTDGGFRVIEAHTADRAVELLEANPDVRVLVTDVEMPGTLNGYALARMVRVRWPSMGIVICSGRSFPKDGDVPDGVQFLGKPFQQSVLLAIVHRLVGHAGAAADASEGGPQSLPRSLH